MDTNAEDFYSIFERSIEDWHKNNTGSLVSPPYQTNTFKHLVYTKNKIDCTQWHIEDEIRVPDINPANAVMLKRMIDSLNQDRTNLVEKMDDVFVALFKGIVPKPGARINSESPAWLLDRMSILCLKIYHMREQTERKDIEAAHVEKCKQKLDVLLEQRADMQTAFDQLIEDIKSGDRMFKVYRQMKMYNDETLNPVLYGHNKTAN